MRLAGELVLSFVEGRTLDDYRADALLRSGVERQLAIIGEALGRLSRVAPASAAAIASRRQVIGFRNVLVHGYDIVDDAVVWDIAVGKVPALLQEVLALLDEDTRLN